MFNDWGERRERLAVYVYCEEGHECSGYHILGKDEQIKFCKHCGKTTQYACNECGQKLVADGGFIGSTPPPQFCEKCGSPFPWRHRQMRRVRRLIEETAEVEKWHEAVKERAVEVAEEIETGTVTPAAYRVALDWMVQRSSESVRALMNDVVVKVGSEAFKAALRMHGISI